MRAGLLGLAVLLAAALIAASPSPASRADGPSLTLVRLVPLELRGARFVARERVRVALSVGRVHRSREVRASSTGSFRVRFDPFLAVDVCRGALVVTARGSEGSRAVYRRACRPPHPLP